MKKVILTAVALVAFAQAENVVHYDKTVKADTSISKPNYPSNETYTTKK